MLLTSARQISAGEPGSHADSAPHPAFSISDPQLVFADEVGPPSGHTSAVSPVGYETLDVVDASVADRIPGDSLQRGPSVTPTATTSAPDLLTAPAASPLDRQPGRSEQRLRTAESPTADFSAGDILSKLVRGTVVVGLLLTVCLWLLRRWTVKNGPAARGRGTLHVIDSTTLGGRCQLQLVDAEGHRALVGIDSSGVKCITVLPPRFTDVLQDESPAGGDLSAASDFESATARNQQLAGHPS